jgi:oxygen-independent coproporphyrinogen-3 oxidase
MDLMCNTPVNFDALGKEFGIEFAVYFADELAALRPFVDEGLIAIDRGCITTLPKGRLFVRAVAMVFDNYLKLSAVGSFSRVI